MFKIAWHPIYSHPLPKGHRFPMEKYDWLPQQLILEGIANKEQFFEPKMLAIEALLPSHEPAYISKVLQLKLSISEIRRMGFPLSKELIERELYIAQGTIDAALWAIEHQIGFNIAGGTHHAGSHWAEGFCVFNDQAIAANYLIKHLNYTKIAIIDLDVHQGNGTAQIFQQEAKVYTFSMHGANNFPFRKECSDWDIPLADGIHDEEYLLILSESLKVLFEKVQPQFIFYQAGVDLLSSDALGRMNLSLDGCKKRDQLLLSKCHEYQVPIQISMGGGYSKDIKTIVKAHCNTFSAAKSFEL